MTSLRPENFPHCPRPHQRRRASPLQLDGQGGPQATLTYRRGTRRIRRSCDQGADCPDARICANRHLPRARADWQLFVSADILDRVVLGISDDQRQIIVGPIGAPITIDWREIARVAIERNGRPLTSHDRGLKGGTPSASAALPGGISPSTDNLLGTALQQQSTSDLVLRIFLDPRRPAQRVPFFNQDMTRKDTQLTDLRKSAEHLIRFYTLLVAAMRSNEQEVPPTHAAPRRVLSRNLMTSGQHGQGLRKPSATVANRDVEGRVSQLWKLHQAGALTKDEFEDRKAQILSRK